MHNSVHRSSIDFKWYFWNHSYTKRVGPFNSREEAIYECGKYAEKISKFYKVEQLLKRINESSTSRQRR